MSRPSQNRRYVEINLTVLQPLGFVWAGRSTVASARLGDVLVNNHCPGPRRQRARHGYPMTTTRRPMEHRRTTVKLRSEGLTWQEIDGELVILDLTNSVYLTTNAAGAVIAKLLTEERTVDELSGALVATFGIENDIARQDTEAFVKQLKDKRLLD